MIQFSITYTAEVSFLIRHKIYIKEKKIPIKRKSFVDLQLNWHLSRVKETYERIGNSSLKSDF